MKNKVILSVLAFFVVFSLLAPCGYSKDEKIGYVDIRRTFYEYEKTKNLEGELNTATQKSQDQRTKMVEEITKMRDEMELLSGKAKEQKQAALEKKLGELQEFDRTTRQTLLNRKNDMFREVIEDIQKVVNEIGEKEGYDYVLDARNVMYAKEQYDLTDKVVKQINKK